MRALPPRRPHSAPRRGSGKASRGADTIHLAPANAKFVDALHQFAMQAEARAKFHTETGPAQKAKRPGIDSDPLSTAKAAWEIVMAELAFLDCRELRC